MDIAQQCRQANGMKIFCMMHSAYPTVTEHENASKTQCQMKIRRGKAVMKAELGRQKELVISKRETLAESKVLKRNPELIEKEYISSNLSREDLIDNQLKETINK
jgi:hypothetical protein